MAFNLIATLISFTIYLLVMLGIGWHFYSRTQVSNNTGYTLSVFIDFNSDLVISTIFLKQVIFQRINQRSLFSLAAPPSVESRIFSAKRYLARGQLGLPVVSKQQAFLPVYTVS